MIERSEPVLATSGLRKRYRRRGPWVLDEVSISVPQGSITAIVGPNGAGKSTLIRTWMGFERPTHRARNAGPGATAR